MRGIRLDQTIAWIIAVISATSIIGGVVLAFQSVHSEEFESSEHSQESTKHETEAKADDAEHGAEAKVEHKTAPKTEHKAEKKAEHGEAAHSSKEEHH